jgi:hypothetical protein
MDGLRPCIIFYEGDAVFVVAVSVLADRLSSVETFFFTYPEPLLRRFGNGVDIWVAACRKRLGLAALYKGKRFLARVEGRIGVARLCRRACVSDLIGGPFCTCAFPDVCHYSFLGPACRVNWSSSFLMLFSASISSSR